jgi:hypothetical protein
VRIYAGLLQRRKWSNVTLGARAIERTRELAQERAWERRAEAASRLPDLSDRSDREGPATSGETT